MATTLQEDSNIKSGMVWSVFTGIYMFSIALILSSFLYSILSVLAEAISLSVTNPGLVFAIPALVFGAGTWWKIVEQRDASQYRHGVIVGVATALLAGLVWATVFVAVWGFEMLIVPMNAFLILLVLSIAALVGGLASLPLMFARHRSNGI
ncbi:hypothetical protein [Halorubrum xinjiangense]|uniref:hypothetical protein n=1 Tax=Halorubrum xinjiangense TaxID=261291 RepID=UPI00122DC114|nr:hypothetical protein [Halorubrum xinjiangense]